MRTRRWNRKDDEGNDIAAEVVVQNPRSIWPFRRYKWTIFAPFANESLANGQASSIAGAMKAADEALREAGRDAEGTPDDA